MQEETVLGVTVVAADKQTLLHTVHSLVGVGGRVYTVNPMMLVAAAEDARMLAVLRRASACIADGVGVRRTLAARGVQTDVLCGVDLGEWLLSLGGSVGFVGGRRGVCEEAFRRMQQRYPSLTAAFLLDGYTFCEEDVARRLRAQKPTYLFVCLGTPRQELLIDRWSDASPQTLCIGLGGSFDVYAGRVRRAPKLVCRMGCEWLWRMLCQPHRLLRLPSLVRYVVWSRRETRRIKCTKKICKKQKYDTNYQN